MLISDDDSNHPYFNPQFNDNNFIIHSLGWYLLLMVV